MLDAHFEPKREGVILSGRVMGGHLTETFITWPMWEAICDRIEAKRPVIAAPLPEVMAAIDARRSEICNDASHTTLGFCVKCDPNDRAIPTSAT